MGSATAYYAARRGLRVCGFDRFRPPHEMGSSHGSSRIIREAYAEDPLYVPLLQRAYVLWEELAERCGTHLLTPCGGLMLGAPDSELVEGAVLSARDHGLDCPVLSAADVVERWPGTFAPPPGTVGVLDARAGVLRPEACIEAFLNGARAAGAGLRLGAEVSGWQAGSGGVRVELADGDTVEADQVLLAAGPWISKLAPELEPHLQVARQVMHWFEVDGDDPARVSAERWPLFVWEHESPRILYGFPDEGHGLKVAIHHDGEVTSVDRVDREVRDTEIEHVRKLLDRLFPGVAGRAVRSAVCMYTNTRDGHFIVDRHPSHPNVLLASPCSGHGFKFAAALGEALAEALARREIPGSLTPFELERLVAPPAASTRVRTGAATFDGKVRPA
jgi:sarcosine oxidase